MPGKVKRIIDSILKERSRGDPILIKTTKTKLMLKGINPDKYTLQSEDDPVIIEKLNKLMKELI